MGRGRPPEGECQGWGYGGLECLLLPIFVAMTTEETLHLRADGQCELSGGRENLAVYAVPPSDGTPDQSILIAENLLDQLEGRRATQPNDWRCLSDSMWSEVPAVKVVAYRMLQQLIGEGWPADLLAMMYLDEETQAWAEMGAAAGAVVHQDSNGHVLSAGDTVVLIKDLKVKGANFTAKRGTAVRRISLVADHAGQIEGKVDGQRIVILTEFVKKK